jgi:ferredoxin-type protein NapH
MLISGYRRFSQLVSTITCNSYVATVYTKNISTTAQKGLCVPVLNCHSCPSALFACPIGTIQHFSAIHAVPYYPAALLALIGIAVGRMGCGWLCPFGFLQDMMYKIRSPKYSVPGQLRYLKYFFLLTLVLALPFYTGELWFSKLCPVGTLTAAIPWAIWDPINPATGLTTLPRPPGLLFVFDVIILIGFLGWFVVSSRPFCKTSCPLGAIFAIFNPVSFVKMKVDSACDGCGKCQEVCPMDIKIVDDTESLECIRCLACTECDYVSCTFIGSDKIYIARPKEELVH